jgi:hypothetical protein
MLVVTPDGRQADPGSSALSKKMDPRFRGDDGRVCFLVTDSPERFARVGSSFLSQPINPADVELIDLSLSSAFHILASLPIDESIKDKRPPEEREGF